MYNHSKAEKVINEIKHFEKDIKPVVKAKILELAYIYEEAIEEKNTIVLTKIKNIKERNTNEEPSVKDIALLINKLREDNFKMISQSWLYKILPEKYRHLYKKEEVKIDEISDKDLYVMKDDLLRRIKDMERGPSQDIKVKETKEDIEKYNSAWNNPCIVANKFNRTLLFDSIRFHRAQNFFGNTIGDSRFTLIGYLSAAL